MTSSTDQLAKARAGSTQGLESFKMYIDGAWCDAASGKFTGKVWAHIPCAEGADVDRVVKAAHAAYPSSSWSRLGATDRGLMLYKLSEIIAANAEYLADLETKSVCINGKSKISRSSTLQ